MREVDLSVGKNICQSPHTTRILCPQKLSVNTTLASQQTHRRSSISDLLSKFAKQKVTVPSPPPPPTYYAEAITLQRGGGMTWKKRPMQPIVAQIGSRREKHDFL